MSKTNFKQPKFIMPLILLPFLVLGFFVCSLFKSKGNNSKMTMDDSLQLVKAKGLNTDMPKVSTDVSGSQTKDKFGAYTEAFKNQSDHTALTSLDNIATDNKPTAYSSYSQADIQRIENNKRLDSAKRALEKNQAIIQRRINGFSNAGNGAGRMSMPRQYPNDNSSAEILEALKNRSQNLYGDASNQYNTSQTNSGKKPVGGTYDEQMRFFKDQIKMVDSMQKANKSPMPKNGTDNIDDTKMLDNRRKFDPSKDTTFKPLHVASANQTLESGNGFNTVRNFKANENIRAIIDEAKKVTAGARVRIKLLQDIFVGENLISAGTYIYGMVSGFQTQRLNITITSINQMGTPLPVKLDVFDNDGYLGLYIPSSNFREFTKDVGTQSTNGLSQIQTSNGTTSDVQTSLISKVFQSTTNTAGKFISQNKATIKADYIIYLKENKSSTKY